MENKDKPITASKSLTAEWVEYDDCGYHRLYCSNCKEKYLKYSVMWRTECPKCHATMLNAERKDD